MNTTQQQTEIDALLAADIHVKERELNLAIKKAANEGLDVNVSSVDVTLMGCGHCEIVNVTVRRKI